MLPKIHSTDVRTELIDLLNCSMGAVSGASLYGCCRWSRSGLPVLRLRGRLGQVRCRKASWGCFGGRHLLEFFVALCFGRCAQM